MASEKEIVEALGVQEMPIAASNLAREVNSTVEAVCVQLKRIKEKGLVISSKDGWALTEDGRATLKVAPPPSSPKSMIEQKVMPYDAFFAIGTQIGLNEDRVRLTADMVFQGDYEDLKWVWDALGQQGLRNDVKSIWFNNWRVYVKKPVPPEIVDEVFQTKTEGEDKAAKGVAGGRDYILVDDLPVRVGQGIGDYNLETAKEMAALRALKGRFSGGGTAPPGAAPPLEQRLPELITALAAFKERPDDDTVNTLLKELSDTKLDALKQEIFSRMPQATEPKSFIEQLSEFGAAMRDLGPILRPMLGIPESPQPGPPTTTPIQITDKDGNPMVLDFATLISFKTFEGNERRADAEQDSKLKTAATARDFMSKIAGAATKMAGRE